ncbi:YfhO family protein [Thermomicrobium sp. 4228-Ro]|uniref:YfhO family protein n=1 Tax=Thermomicrobium sp. 4228-Ro TaxID=2993937 RepID=UPI002248FE9E|nr:YfhO family protein [Thermomicrobium sp. 4228-Ro]MCX2727221.1 YfhO family protein [Thermomicrobium sp. 4228-Ro]
MGIDLAPRTTGLLPPWFVLAGGLLWIGCTFALWWKRSRSAPEFAAVGSLVGAWLLFFWRPLFTAAHVPRGGGDLNSFFFPLHAFAARTVQSGELPLWNPTLFSGMPHWANYQTGILYPPNWLAYLLARPFSYAALEFLVLCHYPVASLGAYVLARFGLRLARVPSLLAGLVFPYSGFLVAHLGHYSMLAAAVWLPWLWVALARSVATHRRRWTVGIAVATFLLATGGHQQTVLYGLTAAGVWWLGYLAHERRAALAAFASSLQNRNARGAVHSAWLLAGDAFRAGIGIASGLALAAPALLPSLELARRSVRSGGLSYEQASEFALQPTALVNLVLPRTFGDNPTNWWGPWANGEVWGYAGIVTLVLAGLGLVLSRDPLRWVLAAIGSLALLHALGPATPIHGWVYRFLPFADLLRAPARSLLFVDLTLALLAAIGVATALERGQERLEFLHHLVRSLVLAIGTLVLLVAPLFLLAIVTSATPAEPLVRAFDGILLLVLWLGLTAVWLRVLASGRANQATALAGVGLVVLDLFSATSPFNPTPDDLLADFRHPEVVEYLRQATQENGPWRLLALTIRWQPSAAAVHGLEDAGGLFDPMQPAAYARVLACTRSAPQRALLDLLNVRFVLTRADDGDFSSSFERRLTSSTGLVLWENPSALPRVWLSDRAVVTDVQTALERVCNDAFDPRQELYLNRPLSPAEPGATGQARASWDGPNRLRVAVEASAPAYLVIAVTADPGWQATLDGRWTPLATADGIYQALWVPAGQHTVVLTYWPPLLGWALAVTLLGLLALSFSLVLGWSVGRRRETTANRGHRTTSPGDSLAAAAPSTGSDH